MATIRGASQRVVRVIGVGAEARGDDAAGLLVARLLGAAAPPDVEILESAGDAGDLLTLLEDADRVIVVDAARSGRQPGTVEVVPAGSGRSPARSTHGLGLVEALDLAATLGVLPPEVRVYAIHGARFDPGPAGPAVLAGVLTAAERILRDELGRRPR